MRERSENKSTGTCPAHSDPGGQCPSLVEIKTDSDYNRRENQTDRHAKK